MTCLRPRTSPRAPSAVPAQRCPRSPRTGMRSPAAQGSPIRRSSQAAGARPEPPLMPGLPRVRVRFLRPLVAPLSMPQRTRTPSLSLQSSALSPARSLCSSWG
ncbi:hypothetical protein B0H17DRAFT_1103509 [Mycena rosella]|uniref:Uncharacterized protein n=1 Tax=Mycena rosella TaxID=1033263 RepID=A0AAD7CDG3_MYCRO|nr:hypothetical protein B0H17DRAFT_1103509 [Mycena rosella]